MKKIQPMEPQRNSEGYWCHPDMPEIETSEQFDAWISSQGLQYAVHCLDGDDGIGAEDAQERYSEGDTDILAWQPSAPAGDGWFIASIHDTEDGPVCLWIRHPTEEQLREAEERKKLQELKEDFLAKHRACVAAAYAYFSACPEGDDRIFASEVYQRVRLATAKRNPVETGIGK